MNARRDLPRGTALEVADFLRAKSSHENFVRRASDWLVATDALEEAGLIHHAQQIRALIALAHHPTSVDFPFGEYRSLRELADQAAHTLETGEAPRHIWGNIHATEDGTIVFDSIYVHGHPSLQIQLLPGERRLVSGDVQHFFRTTYLGHRYSGKTHDYLPPVSWPPDDYEGRGFLVVHRGAPQRAGPRAARAQRERGGSLLPSRSRGRGQR